MWINMKAIKFNLSIEENYNEIANGLIWKYDFTRDEAYNLISEWSFDLKDDFIENDVVDLENYFNSFKSKAVSCGLFHFLPRPKLTEMGTYFCVFNENFVVEDNNTKEILLFDSIPNFYTDRYDLICHCSINFIQFVEFFLRYREWYISNFSNTKIDSENLDREELISILGDEKYSLFLEQSSMLE